MTLLGPPMCAIAFVVAKELVLNVLCPEGVHYARKPTKEGILTAVLSAVVGMS